MFHILYLLHNISKVIYGSMILLLQKIIKEGKKGYSYLKFNLLHNHALHSGALVFSMLIDVHIFFIFKYIVCMSSDCPYPGCVSTMYIVVSGLTTMHQYRSPAAVWDNTAEIRHYLMLAPRILQIMLTLLRNISKYYLRYVFKAFYWELLLPIIVNNYNRSNPLNELY